MTRLLAICFFIMGMGQSAYAFVRSTTDSGTAVFWPGTCAWIFADTDPPSTLTMEEVSTILAKSVDAWQTPTKAACNAYLIINIDPPAAGEARYDQINIVKFRKDKWCRPAEKNTPETCYSANATAITSVFYLNKPGKSDDGTILDADIELNAINFTFVNEPSSTQPNSGTTIADFENTLTHELGHFQGLDHTCWDGTLPQPVDGDGQPVPDCNQLSSLTAAQREKITTATMYPFSDPGEISKRTIKTDDINGICAAYPASQNPNNCTRPSMSNGCSIGLAPSPLSFLTLLVLAVGAGLCLRRSRRHYGANL